MRRLLLALALTASAVAGARAPAANAKLPPVCDAFVSDVYTMPDGKTFALGLRSRAAGFSDVRLTLSSDRSVYRLDLKSLDFQPPEKAPAGPAGSWTYSAPIFFAALPHPDLLLGITARPPAGSEESCLAPLTYTDAYRRADNPKYDMGARSAAALRALIGVFRDGVSPERAVELPPETAMARPVRYRSPAAVKIMRPEYPLAARNQRLAGTVIVRISLDTDDTLADASVLDSSGSAALDAEALKAARASTYKSAIFRCKPIAGNYAFRADFAP